MVPRLLVVYRNQNNPAPAAGFSSSSVCSPVVTGTKLNTPAERFVRLLRGGVSERRNTTKPLAGRLRGSLEKRCFLRSMYWVYNLGSD